MVSFKLNGRPNLEAFCAGCMLYTWFLDQCGLGQGQPLAGEPVMARPGRRGGAGGASRASVPQVDKKSARLRLVTPAPCTDNLVTDAPRIKE